MRSFIGYVINNNIATVKAPVLRQVSQPCRCTLGKIEVQTRNKAQSKVKRKLVYQNSM